MFVTRQYCVETAIKHIKLFFVCHIILLFRTKPYGNIPTGPLPPRGRRMQVGYEKIAIFDQYIAQSRK